MLYRKNLPGWERAARVMAGLAMMVCGLWVLPASPLAYLIAGTGVIAGMTGFVGFCPMCAISGRKLPAP